MPEIGELLNRRGDLSTFVVHLTRDYQGADDLQHAGQAAFVRGILRK